MRAFVRDDCEGADSAVLPVSVSREKHPEAQPERVKSESIKWKAVWW